MVSSVVPLGDVGGIKMVGGGGVVQPVEGNGAGFLIGEDEAGNAVGSVPEIVDGIFHLVGTSCVEVVCSLCVVASEEGYGCRRVSTWSITRNNAGLGEVKLESARRVRGGIWHTPRARRPA